MFLFLSWTCFSLPATFSLIGAALEANRHSMGIGVQMVIKRLPIMIAPFFGGMLIDRFGVIIGVRIALAISIVLSGLTILLQRTMIDETNQAAANGQSNASAARTSDQWGLWKSLSEFNSPMRR